MKLRDILANLFFNVLACCLATHRRSYSSWSNGGSYQRDQGYGQQQSYPDQQRYQAVASALSSASAGSPNGRSQSAAMAQASSSVRRLQFGRQPDYRNGGYGQYGQDRWRPSALEGSLRTPPPQEVLPPTTQRPGANGQQCPSASQCYCCRWSSRQTSAQQMCSQPRYVLVHVTVCVQTVNGRCVETDRRIRREQDGTITRPCRVARTVRECSSCCPTYASQAAPVSCSTSRGREQSPGRRAQFQPVQYQPSTERREYWQPSQAYSQTDYDALVATQTQARREDVTSPSCCSVSQTLRQSCCISAAAAGAMRQCCILTAEQELMVQQMAQRLCCATLQQAQSSCCQTQQMRDSRDQSSCCSSRQRQQPQRQVEVPRVDRNCCSRRQSPQLRAPQLLAERLRCCPEAQPSQLRRQPQSSCCTSSQALRTACCSSAADRLTQPSCCSSSRRSQRSSALSAAGRPNCCSSSSGARVSCCAALAWIGSCC